MIKLSVVIITKNEEGNIRDCLESIKWADEIVIVDQSSSDKTVEICKRYTDKIFIVEPKGFCEPDREFAASQAKNNWILFIDADERVSKKLRDEIEFLLSHKTDCDGFYISYENYLFGIPVKYTWGKDFHLRLIKRGRGKFSSLIHEQIEVIGKFGKLKNFLIHYNSRDIREFIAKNNSYTSLVAREKYAQGERFNLLKMLLGPPRVFFFRYFRLRGYRDRMIGFVLSAFLSIFTFIIHAKLWELSKDENFCDHSSI